MFENFDVIDFLPWSDFETSVDVNNLNLSSGTKIISGIPEDSVGLGLVLHPDIFGLRPLVEDTVFQIAARGIPTIAIEPFTRLEKNGIVGERDENGNITREEKMSRINELDDVEQCADLIAAAQLLRTEHKCQQVAMIGFCIGGMYAFKVSATGIFDAVVSCYGMITLPEHWRGHGQKEPLQYLSQISVSPVLAIIGGKDNYASNLNLLDEVLESETHKSLGSKILVFENADHAFMHDPKRDSYRSEDAKRAWEAAFEFISSKTGLQI